MRRFHLNKPSWHKIKIGEAFTAVGKEDIVTTSRRIGLHKSVLFYLLKEDLGMRRIIFGKWYTIKPQSMLPRIAYRFNDGNIYIFCGEKKLNMVKKEIDLLKLSDNTIIF